MTSLPSAFHCFEQKIKINHLNDCFSQLVDTKAIELGFEEMLYKEQHEHPYSFNDKENAPLHLTTIKIHSPSTKKIISFDVIKQYRHILHSVAAHDKYSKFLHPLAFFSVCFCVDDRRLALLQISWHDSPQVFLNPIYQTPWKITPWEQQQQQQQQLEEPSFDSKRHEKEIKNFIQQQQHLAEFKSFTKKQQRKIFANISAFWFVLDAVVMYNKPPKPEEITYQLERTVVSSLSFRVNKIQRIDILHFSFLIEKHLFPSPTNVFEMNVSHTDIELVYTFDFTEERKK